MPDTARRGLGGIGTPGTLDRSRTQARESRERADLAAHLAVFALVNAVLWINWLLVYAFAGDSFPWPVIPLAVWGIVLADQARRVYRKGGLP